MKHDGPTAGNFFIFREAVRSIATAPVLMAIQFFRYLVSVAEFSTVNYKGFPMFGLTS